MDIIRVKRLLSTLEGAHPDASRVNDYAGRYNALREESPHLHLPLGAHGRDRDGGVAAALEQARADLYRFAQDELGAEATGHLAFEWSSTTVDWSSTTVDPQSGQISHGWIASGDGTLPLRRDDAIKPGTRVSIRGPGCNGRKYILEDWGTVRSVKADGAVYAVEFPGVSGAHDFPASSVQNP